MSSFSYGNDLLWITGVPRPSLVCGKELKLSVLRAWLLVRTCCHNKGFLPGQNKSECDDRMTGISWCWDNWTWVTCRLFVASGRSFLSFGVYLLFSNLDIHDMGDYACWGNTLAPPLVTTSSPVHYGHLTALGQLVVWDRCTYTTIWFWSGGPQRAKFFVAKASLIEICH